MPNQMYLRTVSTIFRRELAAYFTTPVAYVFIVIFLVMSGALTYYLGGFFERSQADLQPFFTFHPWLYLFLIPALSMRLWAEERKTGSIELLLSLPITVWQAVLGKYLAAWAFTGIALALTFPFWMTVNALGHPDNGVIITSYLGSFLMAGAFLAIGAACSALTKNQVIAFVLSAALCFVFTVSGTPVILAPLKAILPASLAGTLASLSFLGHFSDVTRGELAATDLFYFASVIALFLTANAWAVELKKAD